MSGINLGRIWGSNPILELPTFYLLLFVGANLPPPQVITEQKNAGQNRVEHLSRFWLLPRYLAQCVFHSIHLVKVLFHNLFHNMLFESHILHKSWLNSLANDLYIPYRMLLVWKLVSSRKGKRDRIGTRADGRGGKLGDHVNLYLAEASTQTTSFPSKIPSIHLRLNPRKVGLKFEMYKVKVAVVGPSQAGKTMISNFLADATDNIGGEILANVWVLQVLLQENTGPQLECEYLSLNLQVEMWQVRSSGWKWKMHFPMN